MAGLVFFSHVYPSDLDGKKYQYPERGELGSHPWGEDFWIEQALSAVKYLAEGRQKRYSYYYYPILARICSEGKVKG